MFMSEESIFDSELNPLGMEPIPSVHVALGKLKSPARIRSGSGVPNLAIVFSILFIIILSNDDSRSGPR